MKMITRRAALALAVFAAAPQLVAAQDQLPRPAALVTRYVEAIGGRDAVLAAPASRTTGTFEMAAAGLKGELEVVQSGNRIATKVSIPGLGVIRNGYDGRIGWSLDPMTGARLLEGKELDAMRDEAHELSNVRDASLFTSMETIERTEIGGEACFLVKLVWKSGRETFDCYSVDTGLMVATRAHQESPMGRVEATVRYTDYKEFGGLKMPTRILQDMMGMQQTMTILTVEFGNVDAAALELPAEIKALPGAGS